MESLAAGSAMVVSLLALGAGLNTMMSSLDLLQMAHGWLKPALISRLIAICMLVPCLLFLVPIAGLEGAGIAWLLVYIGYVMITPHFVYRRLLKGEKAHWYFRDMAFPFVISCITVILWRVILPIPASRVPLAVSLLCLWGVSSLILIMCLPYLRQDIIHFMKNLFRKETSPLAT